MAMAATLQGIRGVFFGLEIHGVEAELVDAATGHGGSGVRGATHSRDGGGQLRLETNKERAEGGARERGGVRGGVGHGSGRGRQAGGGRERTRARHASPLPTGRRKKTALPSVGWAAIVPTQVGR